MRNRDFLRAGVRRSSVASVALERFSESFSVAGVLAGSKTFLVFSVRAWLRQHPGQRVQRALELFAFRLAQRRLRAALDAPGPVLPDSHPLAGVSSREQLPELAVQWQAQHLFHRPCLLERSARDVRGPAVVPITFQLAAR